MKKLIIVVVFVAIVIVGLVLGFQPKNNSTEDSPIRIGALLCMTGVCAEWGENSLEGIELAIAEINENGGMQGRQIELVLQDSQEDTVANAVSGYRALRAEGIEVIIGPTWTPAALALKDIAAADEILMIAPSVGVSDLNEAGENLFVTWTHDEEATRGLAHYAIEQGWMTAALFSSKQPWEKEQGESFRDEYKKLGGELLIDIEPADGQSEFRTEALKVVEAEPDVVMFTNLTDVGGAARDLKTIGYDGPQLSIWVDDTQNERARGGLNGTIYAQSPEMEDWFMNDYQATYGEKPGVAADTAYDAMMLIDQAMRKTKDLEPPSLAKYLNTVRKGVGAAGPYTMDEFGAVSRDPQLWVVKGEEFEKLN